MPTKEAHTVKGWVLDAFQQVQQLAVSLGLKPLADAYTETEDGRLILSFVEPREIKKETPA